MRLELRRCKSCGAKLHFVESDAGKIVPIDASAPVYVVRENERGEPIASLARNDKQIPPVFVSHFATCPHASRHSRGAKR